MAAPPFVTENDEPNVLTDAHKILVFHMLILQKYAKTKYKYLNKQHQEITIFIVLKAHLENTALAKV